MVFAHGIGGRADLPIPLWLFTSQSIIALVGSVILLALFWKTAKFKKGAFSREIKSPLILKGWTILEVILRVVSLAIFLAVLFAALFGTLGDGNSIAPVTIFIIFWVGLVILSGLLGDTWQFLSPWDTLALAGSWIKKTLFKNHSSSLAIPPPSPAVSSWIAIVGLFVFVWLELVHSEPDNTRLVGFLIFIYTIFLLTGASLWGRKWLKQADAFALLHHLVGSLGIFSKRRIHAPFTQTARLELSLPQLVFVLVFLGSTAFDGVTNTGIWEKTTGWMQIPFDTFGLVAAIGIIGTAYFLAMTVTGMITKSDPFKLACSFGHTLIPIALAYSIAHYFSLLIFEGQDFIRLLSDPFDLGWNLFGTSHIRIDYLLVSTSTIAWVQGISIVVGHVLGVFLAHDKALSLWPHDSKLATRSQYPLLVVMIAYTVLGLLLLLNA